MSTEFCKKWALEQLPRLRFVNGSSRGDHLKDLIPVPDVLKERRKEILAPFEGAELEPLIRDYLLITMPGQYLNRHIDESYPNGTHLRLNWFLSVAESGGEFIVGTKRIVPQVDEVHMIDPTEPHHINTVRGESPIVVISFGIIAKC